MAIQCGPCNGVIVLMQWTAALCCGRGVHTGDDCLPLNPASSRCHTLPYRSGPPLIYMDSVTLVLPLADFGALYALARIGGQEKLAEARRAYPGWAAVQSSVLDRVSVFITDRCGWERDLDLNLGWASLQSSMLDQVSIFVTDGCLLASFEYI